MEEADEVRSIPDAMLHRVGILDFTIREYNQLLVKFEQDIDTMLKIEFTHRRDQDRIIEKLKRERNVLQDEICAFHKERNELVERLRDTVEEFSHFSNLPPEIERITGHKHGLESVEDEINKRFHSIHLTPFERKRDLDTYSQDVSKRNRFGQARLGVAFI